MSTLVFEGAARAAFAETYPERPTLLDHGLGDHPLLQIDALAALAARIRPVDVEYNRGDLPVGIRPEDTPANGLSVEQRRAHRSSSPFTVQR